MFFIICVGTLNSSCYSRKPPKIVNPFFTCSNRLDKPYGVCTHINRIGEKWEFDTREEDIKMMSKVGANFIRTDFDWSYCIAKKDSHLKHNYHDLVVHSVGQSLNILGILSPVVNKEKRSSWKEYVASISRHYSKKIKYWEVINEANRKYKKIPSFNASVYADIIRDGYETIKREGKNLKVLFSGISLNNPDFVDTVFQLNGEKFFDIMNLHRYPKKMSNVEELIENYKTFSYKMKKYNIKKPIWLTETGYSTYEGKSSENVQAMILPRLFLISFACGIDKVFWYKSRSNELSNDKECHFGLWHWDYSPKPAFYTYRTLTRMCPDKSTRPRLMQYGKIYVASWRQPGGRRVWALWTSIHEVISSIKIRGTYKVVNDRGYEFKMKNLLEFKITPSVTYIVGAEEVVF